jgi:hypothetical protein
LQGDKLRCTEDQETSGSIKKAGMKIRSRLIHKRVHREANHIMFNCKMMSLMRELLCFSSQLNVLTVIDSGERPSRVEQLRTGERCERLSLGCCLLLLLKIRSDMNSATNV